MRSRAPTWLTTLDYVGRHRYSLTLYTYLRQPRFVTAAAVDGVLGCFLQCALDDAIDVLAYCFMPDQVHLLVAGRSESSSLRDFVRRAKRHTGYHWRVRHGGRLWQRYSWDKVLRDEEQTAVVVRYILENPVRAGLVARPLEYPYSGSGTFCREDLVALWD